MIFGGLYHWYPKVTGRLLDDRLGKLHFWITFLGTYAIFFPMHYLGFLGMPRRYYAFDGYDFIPASAHQLSAVITVMALVVDTPAANVGDVVGDLQRRSGRVLSIEDKGGRSDVTARAPLAQLSGYTTTLRSLTQGRASASMVFDGYEVARGLPKAA